MTQCAGQLMPSWLNSWCFSASDFKIKQNIFLDTLIQIFFLKIMKMTNVGGDLTDVSAEKEALCSTMSENVVLIELYSNMTIKRFPSSSWSCQCPCGCSTVVKRYIKKAHADNELFEGGGNKRERPHFRTRVKPCSAPENSFRWSTPKSAKRIGSSR